MRKQIKVTDTRIHEVKHPYPDAVHDFQIPVAEAKLVLVRNIVTGILFIGGKHYNPILISETEKIEVGDKYIDFEIGSGKQILTASESFYDDCCKKILALPEHFSPKHLQDIVDGKLKDGDKVLVECEIYKHATTVFPANLDAKDEHRIKLNSSNHITLHMLEERTYTREEVKVIVYSCASRFGNMHVSEELINNWFEQNVK